MRPILEYAEFDVVIVGSGIAGALVGHQLAQSGQRVLILEAGGVPNDSLGRWAMVHNFTSSPSKAPDSPFCGDDVLPVDQSVDPKKDPGKYRFLQPSPIEDGGKNFYDYDAESISKKRFFKSYYERIVGGSTWHWQGIYIRMLPNDFKMKSLYKVGFDWPISYRDLEPWYVRAEYEMGVAGSDEENEEYYQRKFGAYRSKRFPMPPLVPSYNDRQLARAINGKSVPKHGLRLQVNTVPHAINSQSYDGRPECDGHTSCVPLCPIKARYEAIIHVEKAIRAGAILRTQAVVTKMDVDPEKRWVSRVWYKRPDGTLDRASGRIVVIAANGIENPRILLSSNAATSSDKVGRYLMDHPIKQSFALAPKALFPIAVRKRRPISLHSATAISCSVTPVLRPRSKTMDGPPPRPVRPAAILFRPRIRPAIRMPMARSWISWKTGVTSERPCVTSCETTRRGRSLSTARASSFRWKPIASLFRQITTVSASQDQ